MVKDLIGKTGKINWKALIEYMGDATEGISEKYIKATEQLSQMGVFIREENLGKGGFGIYKQGILSACPRECGLYGRQLFFFTEEDAKAYAKAALSGESMGKDYTIENVAERRGMHAKNSL